MFQKINTYLQESLKNNGNKHVQFLDLLTPSEIMVLNCTGMERVYGEEWKALYDKVEKERKQKFGDDSVMPFTQDDMPFMNYTTAAFLNGYVQTEDTSARAMEAAVAAMRTKQKGRVALKKYDDLLIDCVKWLFITSSALQVENDELRKEVARLKALTAGAAAPAAAKNQCQNCGKWGQHTAKDCTFKEGGQAAAHPAGKGHGGGKGSTGGKGQGKGTVRAVAAATKGLGNWLTPAQRAILQETAAQMAKSNQQGYEQD